MEHKADIWIERFGAYLRAERHYSEQTLSVYVPALEEFAAFIGPWCRKKTSGNG